jgi:hypothetical protein
MMTDTDFPSATLRCRREVNGGTWRAARVTGWLALGAMLALWAPAGAATAAAVQADAPTAAAPAPAPGAAARPGAGQAAAGQAAAGQAAAGQAAAGQVAAGQVATGQAATGQAATAQAATGPAATGHIAAAAVRVPATLTGHAIWPAARFIDPPPDAPPVLRRSGRALEGLPADLPAALRAPFRGQPVQGFSGLQRAADGSYWAIADNGFGARANSADAMLMLHRLRIDWVRGRVERVETLFLSDPQRRLPRASGAAARGRYLTGADLDPESLVAGGDGFWIGDEFGPYLVHLDRRGQVTRVVETQVPSGAGMVSVQAPEHPSRAAASPAMASTAARDAIALAGSRGFEGLAARPGTALLYALLEAPLPGAPPTVKLLEFDPQRGEFTGAAWDYELDAEGHLLGDIAFIDRDHALVIERDNGSGSPRSGCAATAKPHGQCFAEPARFKRIYRVRLAEEAGVRRLRKQAWIDLLEIEDPDRRARRGGYATALGARFEFPFVTIESVLIVDAQHIVVANDNNLPTTRGRDPRRPDASEFIRLRVPELLRTTP